MTQEEKKNLVLAIIENAKARYQFPVFVFGDSTYYLDEAEKAMLEYMEDDMAHDNLTQEQYFDRQVACAKSLTVEELITGTYDSETPQYLLDNFKMMLSCGDSRMEDSNVIEKYIVDKENNAVIASFEDDFSYNYEVNGWKSWDGTSVVFERAYWGDLSVFIDGYQYCDGEVNDEFWKIIEAYAPLEYSSYDAVADDIIDDHDSCAFLLDRVSDETYNIYIIEKCDDAEEVKTKQRTMYGFTVDNCEDVEEVKRKHLAKYGRELEEIDMDDDRLRLEELIEHAIIEYANDVPEEKRNHVYIGYKH